MVEDAGTVTMFPMSDVGVDLFDVAGHQYLVMVDRFSGFPFVSHLSSTSTEDVWKAMDNWFLDWGYPCRIRSDGGPQFRQKFDAICETRGIKHELSSAYNPRSNGLAESAVKSMKRLIQKCKESKEPFGPALLAWRNCPRADGFSPATLFLGRRFKTMLPVHPMLLEPVTAENIAEGRQKREERGEKAKEHYDSTTISLPLLPVGSIVSVQNPLSKLWNSTATILEVREGGRSYVLSSDDRAEPFIRNRRFLRKPPLPSSSPDEPANEGAPGPLPPSDHSYSILSPPRLPSILSPTRRKSKRLDEKRRKSGNKKQVRFNV